MRANRIPVPPPLLPRPSLPFQNYTEVPAKKKKNTHEKSIGVGRQELHEVLTSVCAAITKKHVSRGKQQGQQKLEKLKKAEGITGGVHH